VIARCPLCDGDEATRLLESRDRVHDLPGRFTIFGCRRCRALFIDPWLTPEQLAPYYPEHYGRYRVSRSLEKRNRSGLRRFVLENYYGYPHARRGRDGGLKKAAAFVLSFAMARNAVRYHGEGKFLDVGCGGGSYLYRLKQLGWNVYGVEPSPAGALQAQSLGVNVCQGELQGASFPESFFDAIRLSHVLEHLTDPQGTLREISRILKPDGLVYVTVPNTRSLNFWLFGKEWYSLDTPRHVISYSPSALKFLCDATGFDIVKLRFSSGAFNFVRSVKYLLEEKGDRWPLWLRRINWPRNKLIRRTLKPFFFMIDQIRLGDVMVAILRKNHSAER